MHQRQTPMFKTNSSKCTKYNFPVSNREPVSEYTQHPRSRAQLPETLKNDTKIRFRLGSEGFQQAQKRDHIVEMKDSVLGLKQVLRCILWHVAPPSVTRWECLICVMPLH